jgi:leucyl aminopeptidase
MKLAFEKSSLSTNTADVIAVFVHGDKSLFSSEILALTRKLGMRIPAAENGDFTGKEGESVVLYVHRARHPQRYVVVGIGERKKLSVERYRRSGAVAAKCARSLKAKSLTMFVPLVATEFPSVVSALAEGAFLALYKFDKYISKKPDNAPRIQTITVCAEYKPCSGHKPFAKPPIWRVILQTRRETKFILKHLPMLPDSLQNAAATLPRFLMNVKSRKLAWVESLE